jgi:two-component system chemotaxis response regulator CheB
VIGTAADPVFAMAKMNQDWPDVVVLDMEMPRMDSITFVKTIMSVKPTPIVIYSASTETETETTYRALAAGAVGIVAKPKTGFKTSLEEDFVDIIRAIKAAALTDMQRTMLTTKAPDRVFFNPNTSSYVSNVNRVTIPTAERVVAIGTSTGGTQALEVVLPRLSPSCPGIVIVQHMPEIFTAMFSDRLNDLCQIEVKEAENGDRVIPGRALIAPGGIHMSVKRSGMQYIVDLQDGPLVNRHRPSVDVLFRSVAQCVGKNALGIIMTGMGDDGARGLKEMYDAGARTVGQDKSTCVVYGMPNEAMKLGAVQHELPLADIPAFIEHYGRHC